MPIKDTTMTKAHHKTGSGSQKPEVTNTKSSTTNKQATSASTSGSTIQSSSSKTTPTPSISIETEKNKGKQSSKNRKSAIGGTAVQGAKSTQPKEITASSSPAQQEAESYNREM